jgi:cold shock CspA family protein
LQFGSLSSTTDSVATTPEASIFSPEFPGGAPQATPSAQDNEAVAPVQEESAAAASSAAAAHARPLRPLRLDDAAPTTADGEPAQTLALGQLSLHDRQSAPLHPRRGALPRIPAARATWHGHPMAIALAPTRAALAASYNPAAADPRAQSTAPGRPPPAFIIGYDAHTGHPRYRGRVKFFRPREGFGFVVPEAGGGPDVFVHHSAIVAGHSGFKTLCANDIVEYSLTIGPQVRRHAQRHRQTSAHTDTHPSFAL